MSDKEEDNAADKSPSLNINVPRADSISSGAFIIALLDKVEVLQRSSVSNKLTEDNLKHLGVKNERKIRATSSVTSRRDVARIVRECDSQKGASQTDFEDWKRGKWGESEVEGVDLDPDDFDIELLGDVSVPSRRELFWQIRLALSEACALWFRITNSTNIIHNFTMLMSYIWNSLENMLIELHRKFSGPADQGSLTASFSSILLALLEIILSLFDMILTVSGLKFVIRAFDRPTLLKISFLPNVEFPSSRFRQMDH
eukprot:GHVH01001989.1.p1 GENE.GHVH01001989.1~~GHVH01001989.1.p1  ORF type:complete len:257 (+),score=27.13 GHVH01001989.1:157-927(+)